MSLKLKNNYLHAFYTAHRSCQIEKLAKSRAAIRELKDWINHRYDPYSRPLLHILTFLPEWRIVLLKNPSIIEAIEEQSLNYIMNNGLFEDTSALYFLCSTQEGQEILERHPSLVGKINMVTLYHTFKNGQNKQACTLHFLAKTSKGRDILDKNPHLIYAMPAEMLTRVIPGGELKSTSILSCLQEHKWKRGRLKYTQGRLTFCTGHGQEKPEEILEYNKEGESGVGLRQGFFMTQEDSKLGMPALPNAVVETVDRREDKKVADGKKRMFKPTDCEEVIEKSRKRLKM